MTLTSLFSTGTENLELFLLFIIFLIGAFNLARAKNIIKSIVSFCVLDTSLVLMFIIKTARSGGSIPILGEAWTEPMVDPLPQALMIIALLINAAIISVGLMMSIKLFHFHGSLKWEDIFERRAK